MDKHIAHYPLAEWNGVLLYIKLQINIVDEAIIISFKSWEDNL
jgi:hypothetical protein